ncbi:rhomboid family intramembrane serine protease [Candidatus Pacearchaeota archaeon]|nr:rhomboid family intramembrane serine protease [Candidatus Pacearchaeota archaeon]
MLRRRGFFSSATNIIIALNILFFLVAYPMLLITKGSIVDYIAIKPENILNGDYLWTFVTSMFMHGGVFHLFANMFTLFFIGNLVERIIGKKRYVWFYLISGLAASIFFILFSRIFVSDFSAYAVGASGSIFAIAGLLMILTPNLPVFLMFIPIPIKLKYAVPILLIGLWLISITGAIGIGNTAHLGGLIAGLFYGAYLKSKYPNKVMILNRYFK